MMRALSLPGQDTRLVKISNTVYKIKLQYNDALPCSKQQFDSEVGSVVKAVLCTDNAIDIQTKHLLVHPVKSSWSVASRIGFKKNLRVLKGHPYQYTFTVKNKEIEETTESDSEKGYSQAPRTRGRAAKTNAHKEQDKTTGKASRLRHREHTQETVKQKGRKHSIEPGHETESESSESSEEKSREKTIKWRRRRSARNLQKMNEKKEQLGRYNLRNIHSSNINQSNSYSQDNADAHIHNKTNKSVQQRSEPVSQSNKSNEKTTNLDRWLNVDKKHNVSSSNNSVSEIVPEKPLRKRGSFGVNSPHSTVKSQREVTSRTTEKPGYGKRRRLDMDRGGKGNAAPNIRQMSGLARKRREVPETENSKSEDTNNALNSLKDNCSRQNHPKIKLTFRNRRRSISKLVRPDRHVISEEELEEGMALQNLSQVQANVDEEQNLQQLAKTSTNISVKDNKETRVPISRTNSTRSLMRDVTSTNTTKRRRSSGFWETFENFFVKPVKRVFSK